MCLLKNIIIWAKLFFLILSTFGIKKLFADFSNHAFFIIFIGFGATYHLPKFEGVSNQMKYFPPLTLEQSKMYQCSKCNKSYKYDQSLRMHQRYQCGKEPQFKCNVCPYRTYLKGNMSKHCLRMHGIEYVINDNVSMKF